MDCWDELNKQFVDLRDPDGTFGDIFWDGFTKRVWLNVRNDIRKERIKKYFI